MLAEICVYFGIKVGTYVRSSRVMISEKIRRKKLFIYFTIIFYPSLPTKG